MGSLRGTRIFAAGCGVNAAYLEGFYEYGLFSRYGDPDDFQH